RFPFRLHRRPDRIQIPREGGEGRRGVSPQWCGHQCACCSRATPCTKQTRTVERTCEACVEAAIFGVGKFRIFGLMVSALGRFEGATAEGRAVPRRWPSTQERRTRA